MIKQSIKTIYQQSVSIGNQFVELSESEVVEVASPASVEAVVSEKGGHENVVEDVIDEEGDGEGSDPKLDIKVTKGSAFCSTLLGAG